MSRASHHNTQTLLLIKKLLSLRDGASPLNFIVDNLNQSSKPLVAEYIRQAQAARDEVIYISYDALRQPSGVTHFIHARRRTTQDVQGEVSSLVQNAKRSLVIIDSIDPMIKQNPNFVSLLPAFTGPTSSLVLVHHESGDQTADNSSISSYSPQVLTLLEYLATTVIHVYSLTQAKAKHDAMSRSRAEPVFGLDEEKSGLLVGRGANDQGEVLIEMEHRRKSGRAVGLSFVLQPTSPRSNSKATEPAITLRDDHASFRAASDTSSLDGPGFSHGTFNLDLTQKQKQARDGIVLPYFDAQSGDGQGGRILYEMDREDDFDEEEDEV